MSELYLLSNGDQSGPFSPQQVQAMYNCGAITLETQFWREGLTEWLPVSDLFPPKADMPTSGVRERGRISRLPHSPEYSVPPVLKTETSGLAICSLIFSIFGFFPVAIIMGHIARNSIKRSREMTGSGLALAGLILGYSEICALCIFFLILLSLGNKEKTNFAPVQAAVTSESDDFWMLPWGTGKIMADKFLKNRGFIFNESATNRMTTAEKDVLVYSGGTFANLNIETLGMSFVNGQLKDVSIDFGNISFAQNLKLQGVLGRNLNSPAEFDSITHWIIPSGTEVIFFRTANDDDTNFDDKILLSKK